MIKCLVGRLLGAPIRAPMRSVGDLGVIIPNVLSVAIKSVLVGK